MPLAVIGPRLLTASHSCGRYAWACLARARMYWSTLRAAPKMILTVLVFCPLPWTVISRSCRSMSLCRGSWWSYRICASSDSRIPVARNTAITAASRRCWNERPAQARSSRDRSSPVKTGTGLPGTCGGLIPSIGSGNSSSPASHLKNCCSARYWLLAYALLYRPSSHTIHRCTSCRPTSSHRVQLVCRRRCAAATHRLGIGPHRLGGLALGGQVQLERADLRLESPGVQQLGLPVPGLRCGHGLPLPPQAHHPQEVVTRAGFVREIPHHTNKSTGCKRSSPHLRRQEARGRSPHCRPPPSRRSTHHRSR